MSEISSSFRYTIEISLVLQNGKVYNIQTENIKTITTDYNYDTNNMPIIYLGLNINTTLYDLMVENMNSAAIVLSIYKNDIKAVSSLSIEYIREKFLYIMPSDPNYNKSLEELSGADPYSSSDNYKRGNLALLKIDLLNNNKILINDIIKNSNMTSIIHKYTKHMNMVIEPFIYNKIYNTFIIPPLESITQLISYLNMSGSFYPDGYRFFRDFQRTYLLSTSGNPVDAGDMTYNTIIIKIRDPLSDESKLNTMEIDSANRVYIINVDANSTNINTNVNKDKSYNSILGIGTMGSTKQVDLNIPKYVDSSEKIMLQRVYNDNLDYVNNVKDVIENTSILLNITKTEIDSSLLTPNKEFVVENYSSSRKYDGKFILAYKKEILLQQNSEFISSVKFGLRKVIE